MLSYRKTRDVSVDELDGKAGVDRRIGGGHGWNESAWIVSSGTGVGRSQTCVSAGGLDTEEGLLTLGDVDRDGESVENERKEDKGASLPAGCHDGGGYTVLEAEVSSSVHLTASKSQERPFMVLAAAPAPLRIPDPPGVALQNSWGGVEAFENTQQREHGR